jgi:hypothetical protein
VLLWCSSDADTFARRRLGRDGFVLAGPDLGRGRAGRHLAAGWNRSASDPGCAREACSPGCRACSGAWPRSLVASPGRGRMPAFDFPGSGHVAQRGARRRLFRPRRGDRVVAALTTEIAAFGRLGVETGGSELRSWRVLPGGSASSQVARFWTTPLTSEHGDLVTSAASSSAMRSGSPAYVRPRRDRNSPASTASWLTWRPPAPPCAGSPLTTRPSPVPLTNRSWPFSAPRPPACGRS